RILCQRGGRYSLQSARACGGGEDSLGGDLRKSALRVSGCSLAGRQAELLSTFSSWRGGERGRRAAGDWRVFPQDGGQPGQLSKHAAGD
ncbi:MAG: hypothetical protein ACK56F_23595, partial [bacterium]